VGGSHHLTHFPPIFPDACDWDVAMWARVLCHDIKGGTAVAEHETRTIRHCQFMKHVRWQDGKM
jgi:hypothetical protein